VTTRTAVPCATRASNRTWYPTADPTATPSSWAMRTATDRAAMRLGWVRHTGPHAARPIARQIFGIWVVFPEPVSAWMTVTWWRAIASAISVRRAAIGRSAGQCMRAPSHCGCPIPCPTSS